MPSLMITSGRLKLRTTGPRRKMVAPTRVAVVPVPKAPVGTTRANGYTAGLLRKNGKGFVHPPGYRPLYGAWTDLAAFWAGYEAAHRRGMLRDNPHRRGTRAYESWIDGWAFRLSKLPQVNPYKGERAGWRGKSEAVA